MTPVGPMKYPETREELDAAIVEHQLRSLDRALKACAGTRHVAELEAMRAHVRKSVPLSRREIGRLNSISRSVAVSKARAALREEQRARTPTRRKPRSGSKRK